MSVFAVMGALKSAMSSMLGIKPAVLPASQSAKPQSGEPRHVQLNENAHPLLAQHAPALSAAPAHSGKALLQHLQEVPAALKALPNSAVAQRLNHAPGFGVIGGLEQAAHHLSSVVLSKVAAPPMAGLGGRVSDPQGITLLPGDSNVPRLKPDEGYLPDPDAMQPQATGRPELRWTDAHEGRIPVGNKFSDFIHLSSDKSGKGEKDFFRWVKEGGTESTKNILDGITDSDALEGRMQEDFKNAFSGRQNQGPHKLSGAVVELNSGDPSKKTLLYQPTVEVLGDAASLVDLGLSGHNTYGVLANYYASVSGLKIDINSKFPRYEYVEKSWGDAEAMMRATMQHLQDEDIQPHRILVRPSEFAHYPDKFLEINESVKQWQQSPSDSVRASREQEMSRLLREVGGIGVLLDQGYRIDSIMGDTPPSILFKRHDK